MPAGASRQAVAARHIAVAASGGLDSTALLHCVTRLAAPLGVQVHALHVHHGLHPDASAWQEQLARQCRRWRAAGAGVQLHVRRIAEQPARGDSIEAWARRVRYAALADLAREAGCGHVLLAHHRRDQAETVLLQALRGAGPAGLSAMPREALRNGIVWLRPWLDQPREAIERYVQRWHLAHVSDPANANLRFVRNRLRHHVLPALTRVFPDAETALCAVAHRAQQAAQLLHETAGADLPGCVVDGALVVRAWLALSDARRANVLRAWAAAAVPGPVPETLIERLLHELPRARPSGVGWPAGRAQLQLYRGVLKVVAVGDPALEPAQAQSLQLDLQRPGHYALAAWPGALQVEQTSGPGVPARLLQQAELRPRAGGERFQIAPGSAPRSLKKQFQSRGLPPWQRDGPLVYAGCQLVFVPGLGLDARCIEQVGPDLRALHWLPRRAPGPPPDTQHVVQGDRQGDD